MSAHRIVNLPGAPLPRGYSDAILAGPGRLLALGGHVAFDRERRLQHQGLVVPQVRLALQNLRGTLDAAGGKPEDLVKLTIHTTDVAAYRAALKDLGTVWREILGPTYPAMTLVGVAALFDAGAVVEIDGWAVIPG